ncbi:MAG: dienelactone hydrolase family protein [Chloroflexi bacterium]|nr:dienelactone hydrolase family protein [Chloroflexota bacterium]
MEIQQGMVEFAANGGQASGYLARPAGEGRWRGVVVVQEWWGLEEHIKEVARRFAAEGFVALAPDLYHGRIAAEPDEARKLRMLLEEQTALAELRGAVDYLRALPEVTGVGIVGFCMGGWLAFLAATRIPSLAAAVVFYGRAPEPSDLANLRVPVLALYAEDDPAITPHVPQVSATLAAAGIPFTYHIYPGTRHAFFNDTRPTTYHPAAAADAWRWTLRFFRQHIPDAGEHGAGRGSQAG